MRVVHVAESIHENLGGPAFFVTQLAAATVEIGRAEAEILAFDLPQFGRPLPVDGRVPLTLFPPWPPYTYGWSRTYARALQQRALDPEVVFHAHAIWRVPTVTASRLARRRRLPLLISTNGTLETWALTQRALRKKLVWRLLLERILKSARALCAASEREARSAAGMVPGVPIAVIPIGITPPRLAQTPFAREHKTALYLSRIAPNKGLLTLLQTWAKVRPAGWKLIAAGPDEGGHRAVCERAAAELGLEKVVAFLGPVHGEKKWEVYQSADLFILPTVSENFGMVVLEALAAGLPVITTRGAPWEILAQKDCGWWIELGVEPLVAALREALEREAELPEMGARGRALVEEKFTWPVVAREMLALYEWAAGGGPRPDSVLG